MKKWQAILLGAFDGFFGIRRTFTVCWPSALTAKERLMWCVKVRRDGGHWVPSKYNKIAYMSFGDAEYRLIDGTVAAYRWQYA